MPTMNAEKSILNSILNFAGGKSLTDECVDRVFYITLLNHLIENTLAVCSAVNSSVGALTVLSIPAGLQRHCSAAKQHKENTKAGQEIPVHGPNRDRLRVAMASQNLQDCSQTTTDDTANTDGSGRNGAHETHEVH